MSTVRGKQFVPPPKVDAGVLHMVPRIEPDTQLDMLELEQFCRIVFNTRRKQLHTTLLSVLSAGHIREMLEIAFPGRYEHVKTLRPQQFSVQELCKLAEAFSSLKHKYQWQIKM